MSTVKRHLECVVGWIDSGQGGLWTCAYLPADEDHPEDRGEVGFKDEGLIGSLDDVLDALGIDPGMPLDAFNARVHLSDEQVCAAGYALGRFISAVTVYGNGTVQLTLKPDLTGREHFEGSE